MEIGTSSIRYLKKFIIQCTFYKYSINFTFGSTVLVLYIYKINIFPLMKETENETLHMSLFVSHNR